MDTISSYRSLGTTQETEAILVRGKLWIFRFCWELHLAAVVACIMCLASHVTPAEVRAYSGTDDSNVPSIEALKSAQDACDEMELLTGACIELAQ